MRCLMVLAAVLPLAAPASAAPLDEVMFDLHYSLTSIAAPCGVVSEAEARRLKSALFTFYGVGSKATRGYPRIPRQRLLAIQARHDGKPIIGIGCLLAWRGMFEVQEDFPAGGGPRRPFDARAWQQTSIFHRHKADVVAVTAARACGAITADEAAATIRRSADLPQVRFELTLGQIATAYREGTAAAIAANLPCSVAEEMFDWAERYVGEDETGWVESD